MALREVVLDTESTGLDPFQGHRIVEIGCVELINHVPSGRTYHAYVNPQRPMPKEAEAVHGLGDAFLADKPLFGQVVAEFLAFIGGDPLIIHNAAFDMKFLNAELEWQGRPLLPLDQAIDTLTMARRKFPGSPASLDALCRRFGIDNSGRVKHGALLDSEILAEVYLELIGGRQSALLLGAATAGTAASEEREHGARRREGPRPVLITASEKAAHGAFIAELGEQALWRVQGQ